MVRLLSLLLVLLWSLCLSTIPVDAGTRTALVNETTCPASGSSIVILYPEGVRGAWVIINDSGIDVRIGYVAGSTTPALNGTNSIVLKTGRSLSDSDPSTYLGRVVCASTTGVAAVVGVIREYK